MSATTTLLALVIILSGEVNALSGVNVTRLQNNDKFTNPNHTAVSSCLARGQASSFVDSCRTFHSTNTRAKCSSSSTCCGSCQCEKDYPIYLAHLGKCVNLPELNSYVFRPGSTGCGGRLEIKGGGGDDDDSGDDDDRDGKHDKDVCKAKNWTPPLIDFQKSSNPKIKFCLVKPKDTERCNVQTASYLGFDQWRNFTSFQQRFWTAKNKKDMYLQWNGSAVSHLTGDIVVIKVSCKQKGPKGKYFMSCFMFKTAGSNVVTLATTIKPTTTKPSTLTRKPATAKPTTAKPALPPTTTTKTTTKPAKTNPATTAHPATTNPSTKTTTKPAIIITTTTIIITTKRATAKPRTTAAATTKESKTEMYSTTKPITRFSDATSKEIETTSFPENEPKEKSSEITMTTTERRNPGNDKILDMSRDHSSNRSTTVVVVSVLCTLVALAALSLMIVYLLRKWKRPKKAIIKCDSNNHIDKPESNVYQAPDNVYQLLRYDGKSTAHGQWEPPVYQGLAKGASEGNWGEGEVYTNPSMYQDLKKNDEASGEYLPAYHPLMKSTMEKVPEYDCGYLVLVGEHDKQQDTADPEDPYYFKVEQTIE